MAVDPKKSKPIEVEGRVLTILPGRTFRVQLANEHIVVAHIGQDADRLSRLTHGDRVRLQMSPYDLNMACIVYRMP